MDNIDGLIEKELLQHENFDQKTYKNICDKYGKKNVIKYFVKKYSNLDKEKVDEFLTKYHVFFENIEEKETSVTCDYEEDITINPLNTQVLSAFKLYLNDVKGNKILTAEEEKEIFDRLNFIKSQIKFVNIIDDQELKINFALILQSIKDERQIKNLLKLYKANYVSNNQNSFEYIVNKKEERDILKKYIEIYNNINRPLTIAELISNFPTLSFQNKKNVPESKFDNQIEELIEFYNLIRKLEYSNVKLVISLAKHKTLQMNIEDLIQEGNMGLRKAILKFDASKGFKFSTYATWWINQSLNRCILNQRDLIRKPVHIGEQIKKYRYKYSELLVKLGRNPTREEMCDALNITEETCIDIEKLSVEPVSLSSPIGEEEDTSLQDCVTEDVFGAQLSIEAAYENKTLLSDIDRVLETLRPKEADVIINRFGLHGTTPMTLEELGEKYGVTRERIRQIEAKAIKILRKPKNANILRDYYR